MAPAAVGANSSTSSVAIYSTTPGITTPGLPRLGASTAVPTDAAMQEARGSYCNDMAARTADSMGCGIGDDDSASDGDNSPTANRPHIGYHHPGCGRVALLVFSICYREGWHWHPHTVDCQEQQAVFLAACSSTTDQAVQLQSCQALAVPVSAACSSLGPNAAAAITTAERVTPTTQVPEVWFDTPTATTDGDLGVRYVTGTATTHGANSQWTRHSVVDSPNTTSQKSASASTSTVFKIAVGLVSVVSLAIFRNMECPRSRLTFRFSIRVRDSRR